MPSLSWINLKPISFSLATTMFCTVQAALCCSIVAVMVLSISVVSFFLSFLLSLISHMSIRVHGFLSLKPNFKSLKHWKWFGLLMKNVVSFKFHLLIFWFHLQVAFSFNFSSKPYYSWTQNPNLFSFVKISEVCGCSGGTITRSDVDEQVCGCSGGTIHLL